METGEIEEKGKAAKPEQKLLPERVYKLNEVFNTVIGSVKKDHAYFIAKPSQEVGFSQEEQKSLESSLPFFIHVPGTDRWETNKRVVPFVWDPKLGERDERFANTEKLTNGDSGLLALCAVSADSPERQAQLYRTVSGVILQVHGNNPDLLREWIEKQLDPQNPEDQSINLFYHFDQERRKKTKSEDEMLLPYDREKKIDPQLTDQVWVSRINELKMALEEDQIQPHHLRWIEFLSHSVDVPKLFQTLQDKSAQEEQATPSPAEKQRGQKSGGKAERRASRVRGKLKGIRERKERRGQNGQVTAEGRGERSRVADKLIVEGPRRPGLTVEIRETGDGRGRPRRERGGRGRGEGPPPPPERPRGREGPPEEPRPPAGGAPEDPEEYAEWMLDELKISYANRKLEGFAGPAELERFFHLDQIEDEQRRRELTIAVQLEIDFHNAFSHRTQFIDKNVQDAYALANTLGLEYRDRLYSKSGVALAQRLFNRLGRELLEDAHRTWGVQKYVKVKEGDELNKFHNQENWDTIFEEVVTELRKPVEEGGAGLDERTARARAKLGQELFKWDGQFANLGKELAVDEAEEQFFGGGFEYQMRREFANLAWAKREGAPATDILQDVLDELKQRHDSFRVTDNLSGWGDFFHQFSTFRVRAGMEDHFRGLGGIRLHEVRRGRESWYEIDLTDAILNDDKRGSLEDLPFEFIDWKSGERGEKGMTSAWILADGADAAEMRRELFSREDGLAWRLHDMGLENAHKQVMLKRMGAHLAPNFGRGEQFDLQGLILAKVSERERRKWEWPTDYHGYKEFAGRTLIPAIDRGFYEHDPFIVYNAAVAELRAGTNIDDTWVAQRLLAIHDQETLRSFFGTNDPALMGWMRRVALGDVQVTRDQERLWQAQLASLRPTDLKTFHYRLVRQPLRERVRWDERRPGYELQSDFLGHVDALAFKDEWKLLFIDRRDYKEILEGRKTVNRALAEQSISKTNWLKIDGGEIGFEDTFLTTLRKKDVITEEEVSSISQIQGDEERNRRINEILNGRTDQIFRGLGKDNLVGRRVVEEDRFLATLVNSYNTGLSKETRRQIFERARREGRDPYNPAGLRVDIWPAIAGDPYENLEKIAIHEDPASPIHERTEGQPTKEDLKEIALAAEPKIGSENTRRFLERLGYREHQIGPFRFRMSDWDVRNFITSGGRLGDYDAALEDAMGKKSGKSWNKLIPWPKPNVPDVAFAAFIAFGLVGGFWGYGAWWSLSAASRLGLSPSGLYRYLVRSKFINPEDWPYESAYKKDPRRFEALLREI